MTTPLLEVENLTVSFPAGQDRVRAVTDVSFTVQDGERVGLVGESGAGKTVAALSLMGLVTVPPASVSGRAAYRGDDLLAMKPDELRRVRGRRIAMIFQDPVSCLNPRLTVGQQMVEAIRAHDHVNRRRARQRAVDLLARVGIPAPARRFDEYPHRLSGGMAQRVMIAMAVSCAPELILADEPTTSLDVTIAAQIVDLLIEVCEERRAAVVVITHDLALLARFADRLLVMYGGRVVEEGPASTIYHGASHPYTHGLMNAVIRPDAARVDRLATIPGAPPSAASLPAGCAFHPRCPRAADPCRLQRPELVRGTVEGHRCACHYADGLAATAVRLRARPGDGGRA